MWVIVNKYGVQQPLGTFSSEREAYNVLRKAMDKEPLKGYRIKKV